MIKSILFAGILVALVCTKAQAQSVVINGIEFIPVSEEVLSQHGGIGIYAADGNLKKDEGVQQAAHYAARICRSVGRAGIAMYDIKQSNRASSGTRELEYLFVQEDGSLVPQKTVLTQRWFGRGPVEHYQFSSVYCGSVPVNRKDRAL